MATGSSKLQSSINLPPLGSAPASPVQGDVYFDAVQGLMQYNNGAFQPIGSGSGVGGINYVPNGNFELNTIALNKKSRL